MDYFPAPGRNHLFVPGPTNIPEAILQAMNRNNEDHRSPAIPILSKSVIEDVKLLFGTQNATSFIFPSSGDRSCYSSTTLQAHQDEEIQSQRTVRRIGLIAFMFSNVLSSLEIIVS